ncbi:MAG TPA: 3-phosphoshikimate 1-carboxyvinyltransferase [Bacteroidota bacterium]|nr:3-phosphoshikimate 1-carboxyvinyltransferase [Bacteroidota bacterium]
MTDTRGAREIRPGMAGRLNIALPSSKSYTNRALIAAGLAHGRSFIGHPSDSDDSGVLIGALRQFGIPIDKEGAGLSVTGSGGTFRAPAGIINVGNAGTAMRFLASFAALASGTTILDGDAQMKRRPMGMLVDSLRQAGAEAVLMSDTLPLRIDGPSFRGGTIRVEAGISSQFLSSLLLVSPCAQEPVELVLEGGLSSRPYIDMTLHVMRTFGVAVDCAADGRFLIPAGQRYRGTRFTVEADASSASYFFTAAAITGGTVTIEQLSPESRQGDIGLAGLLERMGCRVGRSGNGITLTGGTLRGITADMNAMPDAVPALAVAAAFAHGPTRLTNIAHLRYKESDRIETIARELRRMGGCVTTLGDAIGIEPAPLHGAEIETHHDHRIAMSFAVAGLRVPGVRILDPGCVAKSFPRFWDEFSKLETKG